MKFTSDWQIFGHALRKLSSDCISFRVDTTVIAPVLAAAVNVISLLFYSAGSGQYYCVL